MLVVPPEPLEPPLEDELLEDEPPLEDELLEDELLEEPLLEELELLEEDPPDDDELPEELLDEDPPDEEDEEAGEPPCESPPQAARDADITITLKTGHAEARRETFDPICEFMVKSVSLVYIRVNAHGRIASIGKGVTLSHFVSFICLGPWTSGKDPGLIAAAAIGP